MNPIAQLFFLFLRLGTVSFGGPVAHIAIFEREIVRKRGWMTPERFLELVGATNLIPGPNSTEMAMHCGYIRRGIPGLIAAGLGFILPSVLITGALAWAYRQYGTLPEIAPFLYGVRPAVMGIMAPALLAMSRKAVKSARLAILGILVMGASFLGLGEVEAILGAGAIGLFLFHLDNRGKTGPSEGFSLLLWKGATLGTSLSAMSLFGVFFKIGAVLFGSGLVLMAYLEDELVSKRGWLTMETLVEAVAIGQFTPGPVLSTATFIGFHLLGWKGALAATVGVFLPSFVYAGLMHPLLNAMVGSARWKAFLDAVSIGALAIMAAVMVRMGIYFLEDPGYVLIAILAVLAGIFRPNWGPLLLVAGGAALGRIWLLLSGV